MIKANACMIQPVQNANLQLRVGHMVSSCPFLFNNPKWSKAHDSPKSSKTGLKWYAIV